MLRSRINRLAIYKTHICKYHLMYPFVSQVRHKQYRVCLRNCVLEEVSAKIMLY